MSQMPFYVSPEQLMRTGPIRRKGIARGRSVIVASLGIFVAETADSQGLAIYDRIGFAAVGKYNSSRTFGSRVRYADLRGFSRPLDVSARGLANAYAQTLGTVFTQESTPYEVEIVVAEVGVDVEADQLYRLTYDGSVADERAFVAMGGAAELIEEGLKEDWNPTLGLAEVLRLAVGLLGRDPAGGAARELTGDQLEVALLDRNRPRRTFRRLGGDGLSGLLTPGPGQVVEADRSEVPGDSPRAAATNPQTQRPHQDGDGGA